MFELYSTAIIGLLVATITVFIQANIAAVLKAKQPNAIPGKINETLSHESFVFRAHRTFHNSLETFPTFFASGLLAIFIGVSPYWAAVCIWVYAISRIVHMTLYYVIATEKNPSPRTWPYLIANTANIALLVLSVIALV